MLAMPLVGAALLAACGSSAKPTAAHLPTPTPTPTPSPTATAPPTAAASLAPTAMELFKARYDKVDSEAWTKASLGMKDAQTPQQIHTVLMSMLSALQAYDTAVTALTPPPDDQVTMPLSKPKADLLAAIVVLETQVKKLDADVQRRDQAAFNKDGEGPYKDAYDSLMGAESALSVAVEADAQG